MPLLSLILNVCSFISPKSTTNISIPSISSQQLHKCLLLCHPTAFLCTKLPPSLLMTNFTCQQLFKNGNGIPMQILWWQGSTEWCCCTQIWHDLWSHHVSSLVVWWDIGGVHWPCTSRIDLLSWSTQCPNKVCLNADVQLLGVVHSKCFCVCSNTDIIPFPCPNLLPTPNKAKYAAFLSAMVLKY